MVMNLTRFLWKLVQAFNSLKDGPNWRLYRLHFTRALHLNNKEGLKGEEMGGATSPVASLAAFVTRTEEGRGHLYFP